MTLRLISRLAKKGYAIIMTTHNPDHTILLRGTIGILEKNGKLQTGSTDSIITQERLEKIYETKLHLLSIEELSRRACLPPNL
jgi:iron complex transport system ATP-binding protein